MKKAEMLLRTWAARRGHTLSSRKPGSWNPLIKLNGVLKIKVPGNLAFDIESYIEPSAYHCGDLSNGGEIKSRQGKYTYVVRVVAFKENYCYWSVLQDLKMNGNMLPMYK
jgi:hypothetical protein